MRGISLVTRVLGTLVAVWGCGGGDGTGPTPSFAPVVGTYDFHFGPVPHQGADADHEFKGTFTILAVRDSAFDYHLSVPGLATVLFDTNQDTARLVEGAWYVQGGILATSNGFSARVTWGPSGVGCQGTVLEYADGGDGVLGGGGTAAIPTPCQVSFRAT